MTCAKAKLCKYYGSNDEYYIKICNECHFNHRKKELTNGKNNKEESKSN